MRALGYMIVTLVAALLALLPGGASAQNGLAGDQHIAMRLVAETAHPRAGDTVTLAIDSTPQPGWHGYWTNPGDAGFPARFDWSLPKGVTAGVPAYPVPTTLLIAGLMNYVYEAPYAPLVTLKVPAGLAAGTALPIRLTLDYLACTAAVCVPGKAALALDLTVGDGAVDPAARAKFDAWRQAIPQPLGMTATYQKVGEVLRIAVPYPADAKASDPYFFPVTAGAVTYAAPQRIVHDGARLVIETKASGDAGGRLDGVLRIAPGRGLALSAAAGSVPPASGGPASDSAGGSLLGTMLAAFGAALIGGLILNVMPCVFPILSLKALSLVREHRDAKSARADALAYAAGVIAVCLALGGVILILRAGGSAVGWAFQLQDPRVVVLLLLLTVALSLNLGGLFEIPTPRFVGSSGAGGAFATGALAAFVATPCSGPFMGAALGSALVLPWPAALAIFAGLGVGIALPFLAIGFVPALRDRLPKPGAWMATFRRILSVPMWLTALALAWVLGRQAGVDGMALGLCGALAIALVLWSVGRRQSRGLAVGPVAAALLVLVSAASAWAITGRHANAPAASDVAGAERFSVARLAALRAQGRPVFAYFTADWCLSCKVNEKAAIDTEATRAAFARRHVAVLVGDWTDGDPALGRFIAAHNRAGVPLYLYYAPGEAEPRVLPQVLTSGMLAGLAG